MSQGTGTLSQFSTRESLADRLMEYWQGSILNMQDSYDPMVASVSSIVIFISVIFIVIFEKIYGVGKLFGGS
ncbi:hypothetical protein ACFVSW_22920 [Neobacillus sp. NPDC058068]|uniref:hypothetical protein n=1 Tax=Neobacillus sp. NPDC058068 TaxID=3346325 RepID=UPI0036D89639